MKKKTKKIFMALVVIGVIALIVLFNIGVLGANDKDKVVETLELQKTTIVEIVSATGKIQPEVEIKITSEVSGEIINLPIKEGQVVKKGDLLVKINPDLYESGVDRMVASLANSKAGLNQAEAQLKEAKFNYDRYKILFDKGVVSKAEWDKAVSTFEVAQAMRNAAFHNVESTKASLTESKDNLNRTTIYSPVEGTISRLEVELGERVLGTQQMAVTELLRVANFSNMEVEVDVNENDIVKVKEGNEAKIEVDAYYKKEFRGIVTSISNSASLTLTADQITNFKVKVRILKESYQDLLEGKPKDYSPFRPGMTATVDIITNKKEDIFAVPISSIVMKSTLDTLDAKNNATPVDNNVYKQGEAVFVKNGDSVKIKWIETGIQDDRNIEVVNGLNQGDIVITGPYSLINKELKQGDLIK